MPAQKITFSDDDFLFIKNYKKVHGISTQWFVTVAVQELIERLKVEQQLKDLSYTGNVIVEKPRSNGPTEK